ncbi:hypothetical protein C8R43DRAFT_1142159 [Mycena crocata]|nr:hypothetical protein C8R43DRAFT_1142159 [Mycena crocata]
MSNFSSIANELKMSVIDKLDLADKHHLRLVDHTLNDLLAIEVPLADLHVAQREKTILLIDGAKSGELGCTPFIITAARIDDGRILLDVYSPKFMTNEHEDEMENAKYEIAIHMERLSLHARRDGHASPDDVALDAKRERKDVDFAALRGRVIKASAGLLRHRFKCPECGNGRSVCPGCSEFSGRRVFSELLTNCGWRMPCPVCIGYGIAYDSKYIQEDNEALDELWKEIDAMLAADREKYGKKKKAKSVFCKLLPCFYSN